VSQVFGKTPTEGPLPNDDGLPDVMVDEMESPESPDHSIVTIVLRQNSAAPERFSILRGLLE
jgi:hypothetical protein